MWTFTSSTSSRWITCGDQKPYDCSKHSIMVTRQSLLIKQIVNVVTRFLLATSSTSSCKQIRSKSLIIQLVYASSASNSIGSTDLIQDVRRAEQGYHHSTLEDSIHSSFSQVPLRNAHTYSRSFSKQLHWRGLGQLLQRCQAWLLR